MAAIISTKRVGSFALVVTAAFLAAAPAKAAEIDPTLLERFKAQAPASYAAVAKGTEGIEVAGQSEMISVGSPGKSVPRKDQSRAFTITRDSAIPGFCLTFQATPTDQERKFVKNGQYWFQVFAPNQSAGTYLLADGAALQATEAPGKLPRIFRVTTFEWYTDAGLRIWNMPLLDVLDNSEFFKLTEVSAQPSADQPGKQLVRLAFEYTGHVRDGFRYPSGTYWADVDPENHWLVARCGLDVPFENAHMTADIAYQQLANGIPFPKTIHVWRGEANNTESNYDDETVSFDTPQQIAPAKEVFYLPKYGIEEAAILGTQTPQTRARWLLLNVGLVGIVAAVILWRRNRARG